MPNATSDQQVNLQERFDAIKVSGSLQLRISAHPSYPTNFELWLESKAQSPQLYAVDQEIRQRVQRKTRQQTSVLGRYGVIDIVCAQVKEILSGSGEEVALTISDLARLITPGKNSGTLLTKSTEKLLHRINQGEFVTSSSVSDIAKRLMIDCSELVFDDPVLYEPKARRKLMRKPARLARIEKETAEFKRKLKDHPLGWVRLTIDAPKAIDKILRADAKYTTIFHQFGEDSETRESREAVIGLLRLLQLPGRERKNAGALLAALVLQLNDLEIWMWHADYQSASLLDPSDPMAGSRREYHVVLTLTRAGAPKPDTTVDLSKTYGFPPTLEDET